MGNRSPLNPLVASSSVHEFTSLEPRTVAALSFGLGARRARRLARATTPQPTNSEEQNADDEPSLEPAAKGEVHHSPAREALKRTFKIALLIVLINYLGIPALEGVRKAVNKLADVQFGWLALGVGLQFGALLAYTQLMSTGLPTQSISVFRLFRIQLATKSLNNVVPGGSAAGAALGYRLLTTSGVAGADAGFALAATGLISAVVLNLLFLVALLISIPLYGFRPAYVTAAIFGLLLIVFVVSLGFAIVRGEEGAERILQRLTKRLKFVDADRIAAIIRQLAGRLREIMQDRELVTRAGVWAVLNWLLDASSLFVFIRAFGPFPYKSIVGLMIAFGLANIAAVIPITPGGLGVIETTLTSVLTGFGIGAAAIPVSLYRIAQYWLPIPLGAIAYFTVRRGQPQLPSRLLDAGIAAYADPESRFDWAEQYGHRNRLNHPSAGPNADTRATTPADAENPPNTDAPGIKPHGTATSASLQEPRDTTDDAIDDAIDDTVAGSRDSASDET